METSKLYNIFRQCTGITTDTRNGNPGSLFFALKGDRFNGNDYAMKALSEGCMYAVVDDVKLDGMPGCILVPDVLKALQDLALEHRMLSSASIIGITGTNGKTTTKELISAVLSEEYNVWYTRGNLNNHIGVPLTLLSMPANTEIAVIEMGANHIKEIAHLCEIAKPDLGIITNVGKAHLEGFGSFEGVKTAKGELYQYLKGNNAPAFINTDNKHLVEMLGDAAFVGYGISSGGLVVGRNAIASPFLEFEWKTENSNTWHKATTRLTGLYNFENALAAVCIGVHQKVQPQLINKALAEYEPVNNRSQLTITVNNKVLMDAYNANPSSMNAALTNFSSMAGDNKVLILGGMKELGNDSMQEHETIVSQLLKMDFKHCYLVGTEFKNVKPKSEQFSWFESTELLINFLRQNPIKNSLIMVKGSRSNRLETVLEVL
jgi:UDP-N-acetylmuramoyl-tripeptide--D-alanyl-D-alanine ligase